MSNSKLTPEQVVDQIKQSIGAGLVSSDIVKRAEGAKKTEFVQIWLTIDKATIKKTIQTIADIHYPHLSVISGCDMGDAIELNYHMYIYYGELHGDYNITVKPIIPKSDLTIDTITDIIPGAIVSEREKQEFFGIKVIDIPDDRRMFLPDDFPEKVYPWRKDETGIQEDMIKKLYEVGKEEGKKRREAAKDK